MDTCANVAILPYLGKSTHQVLTLVGHGVFVLGGDQEVFDGSATLEVGLDAIPATDLFDPPDWQFKGWS